MFATDCKPDATEPNCATHTASINDYTTTCLILQGEWHVHVQGQGRDDPHGGSRPHDLGGGDWRATGWLASQPHAVVPSVLTVSSAEETGDRRRRDMVAADLAASRSTGVRTCHSVCGFAMSYHGIPFALHSIFYPGLLAICKLYI